jgi:hypothetical protein
MLSSSRAKIHEPLVTGVSPRPTDQRGARKLRNTRASGEVGHKLATVYIGSLGGALSTFRSPVPGAPVPHRSR